MCADDVRSKLPHAPSRPAEACPNIRGKKRFRRVKPFNEENQLAGILQGIYSSTDRNAWDNSVTHCKTHLMFYI